MICMVYSTSLSFRQIVYGPGYLCPTVPILGVEVAGLQGKYYEEDYASADGRGFAS